MCGINGAVRLDSQAAPITSAEIDRVRERLAHRGPDGTGTWVAADGSAGLGHYRLAILDLSPQGAQPMARDGGRLQLTFNGEIYNFRELRQELLARGVPLATASDSEVVLALYDLEGPAMLRKLRGMYAFALWDGRRRQLFLARDPYGIKPLYYATHAGRFLFASEVKALTATAGGGVPMDVDPAGLTGFLLWGSVPEPRTFWRDVHPLPAGHQLIVPADAGDVPTPERHHFFRAARHPEPLAQALAASVEAHLVADVPVAVFLSAGLDSALLAALACRQQARPPVTLTLRFDELLGTAADEGPLAAEVARALGTEHIERRFGREDFLGLWDSLQTAMDQPSIDGANTYLIAKLAHEQGFKVALSGLGGDELFGSYPSFRDVPRWLRRTRALRHLPGSSAAWPLLQRAFLPGQPKAAGVPRYGCSAEGAYFLRRGVFLPEELPALIGERLAADGLATYQPLAGVAASAAGFLDDQPLAIGDWLAVHRMESTSYLKNQLLRDADWAAMAHAVELRVPLVDAWLHRAVAGHGFEPVRSLGKAALIRQLAPELPAAVFDRPKSGFAVPVIEWLTAGKARFAGWGHPARGLAALVLEQFGIELARPTRAVSRLLAPARDPRG
jgi:asparagine synthase (glutamine-hydrolysing)